MAKYLTKIAFPFQMAATATADFLMNISLVFPKNLLSLTARQIETENCENKNIHVLIWY